MYVADCGVHTASSAAALCSLCTQYNTLLVPCCCICASVLYQDFRTRFAVMQVRAVWLCCVYFCISVAASNTTACTAVPHSILLLQAMLEAHQICLSAPMHPQHQLAPLKRLLPPPQQPRLRAPTALQCPLQEQLLEPSQAVLLLLVALAVRASLLCLHSLARQPRLASTTVRS